MGSEKDLRDGIGAWCKIYDILHYYKRQLQ
jgi:hypothetical protein